MLENGICRCLLWVKHMTCSFQTDELNSSRTSAVSCMLLQFGCGCPVWSPCSDTVLHSTLKLHSRVETEHCLPELLREAPQCHSLQPAEPSPSAGSQKNQPSQHVMGQLGNFGESISKPLEIIFSKCMRDHSQFVTVDEGVC